MAEGPKQGREKGVVTATPALPWKLAEWRFVKGAKLPAVQAVPRIAQKLARLDTNL